MLSFSIIRILRALTPYQPHRKLKANQVSCLAQYVQHFLVLSHRQVRSNLAMDFHLITDRDRGLHRHPHHAVANG